jgi:hypothetical protein
MENSSTISDLGASCRLVVNLTHASSYTDGKLRGTHVIGDWEGPSAGLDAVKKRKILPLPGTKLRPSSP